MPDPQLIERYRKMSDAERAVEARKLIHMNLPPLNLLFAVMMALDPESVEDTLAEMAKQI
ncbi:hypothetical protein KP003_16850 [Geomonas nitrogeniifigens]|uniref:hypothetical protein n=1 Tax=Geomonas diazotrophica TaxID=2843197 RepID=UPI001C2C1419|nr:hypothetical protein [Geomonas nitrogeniifigens]QXE86011.1 hypothetical protein KP003_16850 [Geomonas nitrogeniifigens]